MARYTARWGGSTALGDEVRRWSARPVRLTRGERALLWSGHARVEDDSANFVWRIEVVVAVKADSAGDLSAYIDGLAAQMLDDGLQDVSIFEGGSETAVRTYGDCRLDGISPGPPVPASLGNLDNALTFTFTSANDPV